MIMVKEIEVLGETVRVEVDPHDGGWRVMGVMPESQAGGSGLTLGVGPSMAAALAKARATIKARRVAFAPVAFFTIDGKAGVVTGIHARNGNMLARIEDQRGVKNEQISAGRGAWGVQHMRADTPPEVFERLKALDDHQQQVRSERERLLDRHKLNLAAVVAQVQSDAAAAVETGGE